MSHDTGMVCMCMIDHRPYPLELEIHHIWPIGMGGSRIDANEVAVCPTTHMNTHELLRLFMKTGHEVSWYDVGMLYDVPVSRYAYELALRGFRAVRDAVTL